MGILNITPDSFSDGGELYVAGVPLLAAAIDRAGQMVAEGATILDVGGESTKPHAAIVTEQEELERVIPVIEALRVRFSETTISIDSSNAQVMTAAVAAGANLINDVRALQQPDAMEAAAAAKIPVVLMHMQGTPATMQKQPQYHDPVIEIKAFFKQRIDACLAAGINADKLIIDPGIGFGKNTTHNLQLINSMEQLQDLHQPIMIGVSRKSIFKEITGRNVRGRLAGSLAAMLAAIHRGVDIVRVHDVAATIDAIKVWCAIERANEP